MLALRSASLATLPSRPHAPRRASGPRPVAVRAVAEPVRDDASWRSRAERVVAAGAVAATLFTAVAPTAHAIDLIIVDPSVKAYMDDRDNAMRMKCEGGMMDCDGDRREYARAQTENFIRRNSGEERILPDCKVEEACTTDILGAAIAGVNGLTTSEKLEKMGRDGGAINGTRRYFGD